MNAAVFSARRRQLLQAGGLLLLPGCAARLSRPAPAFDRDPFSLGVAAGEPRSDGFVIWTRLAPAPLEDASGAGGMAPEAVEVEWLVADDPDLRRVRRQGLALADPAWAHSLHVEIDGLEPDRPWWYAFRVGDWQSRTGRAWTAPAAGAAVSKLRLAYASCQHFEAGWYAAYRHLVADDPQLILHLGDYIYESGRPGGVRRHEGPEPHDLAGYRRRHACYKLDPDLQAAHAHAAWLLAWDDHEVDNDYAGLHGAEPGVALATFAARRAAAYRAYWEHMPLGLHARPRGGALPLYGRTDFGDLLRIHRLDTRQYRSDQACATPQKLGGQVAADCAQRRDPARTLLGSKQEAWLQHGLQASPARWNLIAQPMLMAPLEQRPGPGQAWWTDGWDGYPAARERLLGVLADGAISNPVTLGGDIHSFWATDLAAPGDPARIVATEFVGTSISSPGIPHDAVQSFLPDNPHIRFAEARYRGYVVCELTPQALHTRFRALAEVTDPATTVSTLAAFTVQNGRPGAMRA